MQASIDHMQTLAVDQRVVPRVRWFLPLRANDHSHVTLPAIIGLPEHSHSLTSP